MALDRLHDATLIGLNFDWKNAEVVVEVEPYAYEGNRKITIRDVIGLEVPREQPWGPSVSINGVVDKPDTCEIEMQSGDVIVIRKKPARD